METDGETRAAPGRDMCLLRSAVSARGGRGVFVSITEQQTGPLEMKEPEWSQSKTSSAGRRYPTDSSSPLGPRRRNDPSSWIRSIYTHTHTHRHTHTRMDGHTVLLLFCVHVNVSLRLNWLFFTWSLVCEHKIHNNRR